MRVLHYQRKRRNGANFSLEFIFQDVRDRLSGVCSIRLRSAPFFSNGLFRRLAITLDAWWSQTEVTHVTGDINFAVLGVRGRNAVLTVLDCGFLNRPASVVRTLLKKLWLDWPVRRAAIVTTISETIKQEIIALSGCSDAKVVVVPVAISDAFQPLQKCFNEKQPRILHVGTAFNKNLPRLIEAVTDLPCTLVIIGKIDDAIRQSLQERGVQFENYLELSQADVILQYQLCDLLCFASLYEGFGMPILEAQAVGRPVVTSNVSAMPEVAGEAACFVDPRDVGSIRSGIERIVHDGEYRARIVELGFNNVKRFNADSIARQYLKVYQLIYDQRLKQLDGSQNSLGSIKN